MKAYIKIILLTVGLAASTVAIAKWVGRFYCGPSCNIIGGFANGDTLAFIRDEVNREANLNGMWIDSSQRPNTVTICNGTSCALYKYIALSGMFFAEGYYRSNWKGESGDSGGGGGGSIGSGGGEGIGANDRCHIGTEMRNACTSAGGGPDQCEFVAVNILVC